MISLGNIDIKKVSVGSSEIKKISLGTTTVWEGIYVAQDSDFVKVNEIWVYRGSQLEIKIPHVIQGESITSYAYMFSGLSTYNATPVTRVVSDNPNVTDMSYMFYYSKATTLDLCFDTSNVTGMHRMFYNSQATTGYARTQADADKLNSVSSNPDGLNFVVKP